MSEAKHLWQSLDPLSGHALLTDEGAQQWLLLFPPDRRSQIAQMTAVVLDSTYDGDDAIRAFSERFSAALERDPVLWAECMTALAKAGFVPPSKQN